MRTGLEMPQVAMQEVLDNVWLLEEGVAHEHVKKLPVYTTCTGTAGEARRVGQEVWLSAFLIALQPLGVDYLWICEVVIYP